MSVEPSRPIGIFDSGIGGLTVARAIKKLMPGENLIYFGDTAHLPYGDKSVAAIQAYSVKITDVLLKKNCKAIVIACNSASSAAYDLLHEYAGKRARFINVIDPMIDFVAKKFDNQKVGLIGTMRTVESCAYQKVLTSVSPGTTLVSLATPLLVPMIEEGYIDDRISREIIGNYLANEALQDISALILGCTHYPLIKEQISNYYSHSINILDSSELVAQALKEYLQKNNLSENNGADEDHFLVSDFTPSFEALTARFFDHKVRLEKHVLWE